MTEQEAMRRALDLAVKGWGRVAPNPLVGAVLLKDGEVIGAIGVSGATVEDDHAVAEGGAGAQV